MMPTVTNYSDQPFTFRPFDGPGPDYLDEVTILPGESIGVTEATWGGILNGCPEIVPPRDFTFVSQPCCDDCAETGESCV